MKQQLDAKDAECAALKSQVHDLQRVNTSTVEAQNKAQESFCKVSIMIYVNLYFKIPAAVNRSHERNRTEFQSNPIELNPWIEFDWVRQSNEIDLTQKIGN